ncbi:peroxiredoxin family protein [Chitinophaga vietnamensis]|uniref:peroxiredoxin family protein n=1 Tax=Chitinophaga vietnamensis TaxID=2593957 RepID=UPI0011789BBC|nr:TlpA disulfide reductase family protein [Chitinophaga vietnamensis]
MKKILICALLLFPLTGICQQQETNDTTGFWDLHLDAVMAFFSKDSVNKTELMRDFNALNTILRKDVGEKAMKEELNALDMVRDSIAYYKLVTTKPAAIYRKKLILKQQFVATHPDSYISLYALDDNHGMYSAGSYEAAYAKLSNRLKKMHAAQRIRDSIAIWKRADPKGTLAPDFTRKDQYGETIKLSDYRGKLVILDFWGSWCGACRQSHPHLKELYEAYKDKGLEIIAVANENVHGEKTALSKAKAAWLAAIKKDDVNWVHVLNDEGSGDRDIANAYLVSAYPTKFLLDRDGKILLRIDDILNVEIDQKIKSLLEDGAH